LEFVNDKKRKGVGKVTKVERLFEDEKQEAVKEIIETTKK
jgi:hypothetical protein